MRNPKKYLRAAIRVATTNLRLGFGKLVHGSNLKYNPVTCLALSDGIELSARSIVNFGSRLRTRGRCSFNIQGAGNLSFGNGVFLNSGCQFNCRSSITVGIAASSGPMCSFMIMTISSGVGFLLMGNTLAVTSQLDPIAGSGLEPSFLKAPTSVTGASSPPAVLSRAIFPMTLSVCRSAKLACLKISRQI